MAYLILYTVSLNILLFRYSHELQKRRTKLEPLGTGSNV